MESPLGRRWTVLASTGFLGMVYPKKKVFYRILPGFRLDHPLRAGKWEGEGGVGWEGRWGGWGGGEKRVGGWVGGGA